MPSLLSQETNTQNDVQPFHHSLQEWSLLSPTETVPDSSFVVAPANALPIRDVQVRIGKADWATLSEAVEGWLYLQPKMEKLCSFYERKKTRGNKVTRLNVYDFAEEDLRIAHGNISNALVMAETGAWYLKKSPGISYNCENRATVRVGKKTISATILMHYFMPQLCGVPGCPLRHRTVYDFVVEHPEYAPEDIDLSHLYHDRTDVCPYRLVMEPSKWNLYRSCRQTCGCGLTPPCYVTRPP